MEVKQHYSRSSGTRDLSHACHTAAIAKSRSAGIPQNSAAAGDLLYLPAGWFHNVTSKNLLAAESENDSSAYHLAMNYWFHPPNNLDAGASGFAKPYARDFWPKKWAKERQIWV